MSVAGASIGGVHETPAELAHLQELLDRSFARSSEHLTSIMSEPRRTCDPCWFHSVSCEERSGFWSIRASTWSGPSTSRVFGKS